MALPRPADFAAAPRLRPISLRAQSRSPSRSPARRSVFAAQELDPLLRNLSSQATLQALLATDTISSGQRVPDALAKSIADASTFERELGIRAALTAQKLQEWNKEISAWTWPNSREAALGMGFLFSPLSSSAEAASSEKEHVGCLSLAQLTQYETRLEDMRDALEALRMDEVKDYVLNAHSTASPGMDRMNYGRMRDFTALITATIIRALPDLANLNMSLNLWEVRLLVLRQTPEFLQILDLTTTAIKAASDQIRKEPVRSNFDLAQYEKTKASLSHAVSSLGSRIDGMLDLLEGQEDRLPQPWIDRMEAIELNFATWVVEAQRRVRLNEWMVQQRATTLPKEPASQLIEESKVEPEVKQVKDVEPSGDQKPGHPESHDSLEVLDVPSGMVGANLIQNDPSFAETSTKGDVRPAQVDPPPATVLAGLAAESASSGAMAEQPFKFLLEDPMAPKKQPSKRGLGTLDPPKASHRREISEVSMAESAYSAFSDISQAEIVDATSTQMVTSPKVAVVQNSRRASRDDLSSFSREVQPEPQSAQLDGSKDVADNFRAVNPWSNMTSTPERRTLREATPRRPASPPSSDFGTSMEPTIAQGGLSRPPLLQRASTASLEHISRDQIKRVTLSRTGSQDLSALMKKDDARTPTKALRQLTGTSQEDDSSPATDASSVTPTKPNTSPGNPSEKPTPPSSYSPLSFRSRIPEPASGDSPSIPRRSSKRVSQGVSIPITPINPSETFSSPKKAQATDDDLQAKIQDILTTLPTAIRLASKPESREDSSVSSTASSTRASTRASTPAPALVLAPAKAERSTRRGGSRESEVKVYHLTRRGQFRDAPPTKLFVRLVGENGERVMVRVGGGWADLGEYLREYSLHHGKRALGEGQLEVASFPANGTSPKDPSLAGSSPLGPSSISKVFNGPGAARPRMSSSSSSDSKFNFAALPSLGYEKVRKASSGSPPPPAPGPMNFDSEANANPWDPPPVPQIPTTYTVQSPTVITTTSSRDGTYTTVVTSPAPPGSPRPLQGSDDTTLRSSVTTNTVTTPTISTTNTFYSPPAINQVYTPMGAAGPKLTSNNSSRRATTLGSYSTPENEAWVAGMVGKARAVSGTAQGSPLPGFGSPITSAVSTPASRRASGALFDSPVSSEGLPSPSSSFNRGSPASQKQRSRLSSIGDVSGIKRVFLRRKADR